MFLTSTVGRKLLMALTGQFMVFYAVAHALGNATFYAGAINAYAEGLRHWPFVILLWSSRILLCISLALHAWLGVILRFENGRSKPVGYAVTSSVSATFAGRNMIWTGLGISAYLVFHIMHFTLQVVDPSTAALRHPDALNRPDVLMMLVHGFQNPGLVFIYLAGAASLLLHLAHGIQSSFQTWGMNNDRTLPLFIKAGLAASLLLFLGYAALPVSIVLGIVK